MKIEYNKVPTNLAPNIYLFSAEDLINQGKCLCGQYIRARLRRNGYLNRKVIQRLRTSLESPSSSMDSLIEQVFPVINGMGEELERMHPKIYSNVARQLSCAPFGELEEADSAPILLSAVASDLFKVESEISWSKIVSFFSVTGGLATDCVRQGQFDFLPRLIEVTASIIEEHLLTFLIDNNGWFGLLDHMKDAQKPNDISFLHYLSLSIGIISAIYLALKIIEFLGHKIYNLLF